MQALKQMLVLSLFASLAAQALAMDEDLTHCRYKTGIKMPPDECEAFQRMERKKEEAAERARLQSEQSRAAEAAWQSSNTKHARSKKRESWQSASAAIRRSGRQRTAGASWQTARRRLGPQQSSRHVAPTTSPQRLACPSTVLCSAWASTASPHSSTALTASLQPTQVRVAICM